MTTSGGGLGGLPCAATAAAKAVEADGKSCA
eukprot:CAMPEP_0172901424 /NCGR_PEP_ID=MMETSP1075-20121228/166243_1 /TAXON_ID=2916 /ORGANISM="Ceratium fusus, Strain PA161109" /LENGTH=30 /DNA_ID= /DNA_START= /DNA_END= /DNA_ORIENTATION=